MESPKEYTLIPSVDELMADIPADSITSRSFFKAEGLKAVLFGFDAGQSLSEHRAAHAAIVQILDGKAKITLAGDTHELEAGAWLYMPPQLAHSVDALTAMKMLLLILG